MEDWLVNTQAITAERQAVMDLIMSYLADIKLPSEVIWLDPKDPGTRDQIHVWMTDGSLWPGTTWAFNEMVCFFRVDKTKLEFSDVKLFFNEYNYEATWGEKFDLADPTGTTLKEFLRERTNEARARLKKRKPL